MDQPGRQAPGATTGTATGMPASTGSYGAASLAAASFGVGIRAVGGYLPERVVTNAELEQVLDTTDEWIRTFIGVRTRRWSAPDEWTSDMGAAAVTDACRRAGISPHNIDLLICGTYTPDHMNPATAAAIMRKLGMQGVPGFDINSGGCPNGTFALDVGAKYLASGGYGRVAVVLADVNSKALDPEDRTVGVIFGDGAACYLLERTRPGTGVGPALLRTDPTAYEIAYVKREQRRRPDGSLRQSAYGDNFAYIHGRSVRDFALSTVPDFIRELLKNEDLRIEDVDLVVLHQANYHMIQAIIAELGLPPERTITNVERVGNTSGAGVPLALRDAIDTGRVSPGDVVVLASFGAGMSLGGTVIRWAGEDDFAWAV